MYYPMAQHVWRKSTKENHEKELLRKKKKT
jgi:hypothetical protein